MSIKTLVSAMSLCQNLYTNSAYTDVVSELGFKNPYMLMESVDKTDRMRELQAYISQMTASINEQVSGVRPIIDAIIGEDADYDALSDDVKSAMSSLIGNLDPSTYTKFAGDYYGFADWVKTSLLGIFTDPSYSEASKSFMEMFSLKDSFNQGKMSIAEYEQSMENLKASLAGLDGNVVTAIGKSFESNVGLMVSNVESKLQSEYKGMVKSLTLEDLTIAYELKKHRRRHI